MGTRTEYTYLNQSIDTAPKTFTFANLGTSDESKAIPDSFTNVPIIEIIAVRSNRTVFISAITVSDFTVDVGDMGETLPIEFDFRVVSRDDEIVSGTTKNLMLPSYVKARFPEWETFCTRKDGEKTADEMLQIAIDLASFEFCDALGSLTSDDMTDILRMHLLRMVKHRCFNFLHGDTGFKNKPQIVRDYETTRELLDKGLIRTGNVTFENKDRIFDDWFTDQEDLWFETNN